MNVLSTWIWPHPFLFSCQAQKKAKNGTLAIQTLGATDLKHTQIDFGSNMGRILPCYTTFHWCVKRKSAKKKINLWIKIEPKELNSQTNFNIYFGRMFLSIFVYMCLEWTLLNTWRHGNGCDFTIATSIEVILATKS